ncbi:MAG: cell cycle transcriptional regulator TrcR [Erythrobacter sp.]
MAQKDQPKPLMPHATATWLVDHTALSFEQIAEFCGLHILEVQAMADDLASSKYTGRDPVHAGELTLEEIERGQADASYSLKMHKAPVEVTRTKGPRYTPVSKRQDKPDGIAWILRNHPEVSDAQISKLIGTTRNTIGAIRERSHWNIQNIQPKDPVTLGLCSQRELDAVVAKAAKRAGVAEEAPEAAPVPERNDRAKLIEELRAERDANVKAASEAAQEAEAEAWLAARRAAEAAEKPIDPESGFAPHRREDEE